MLNNLRHKWQIAIKVISELLCATKRITEQCSEEFTTEIGMQERVMQTMFKSVWETAHCIVLLAETVINNPTLISTRNIWVIQRDLIDKIIDIPFIHRCGKSRQYLDWESYVLTPQLLFHWHHNNLRHRKDKAQEVRAYMNQSIAHFVQKYYPTWEDWMTFSPETQQKRLHRQLRNWSKLDHNAKLRKGLLLYIDEGFYNLDYAFGTMGFTTSDVKEDCERLPQMHHMHSLFVHDSLRNWDRDVESYEGLYICILALYVAAAHYYSCTGEPKKLENLQRIIRENPIEHHKTKTKEIEQVKATISLLSMVEPLPEDDICELQELKLTVYDATSNINANTSNTNAMPVGAIINLVSMAEILAEDGISEITPVEAIIKLLSIRKILDEDGICELQGLGRFKLTADNGIEFTASDRFKKKFEDVQIFTTLKMFAEHAKILTDECTDSESALSQPGSSETE